MNSRHLVDPDLLEVFDTLPRFEFTAELLPAIRAGGLPLQVDPVAADVDLARRKVPGPWGAPVELHVYAGAYHAFDVLTNAPIAATAKRDSLAALRRFLE